MRCRRRAAILLATCALFFLGGCRGQGGRDDLRPVKERPEVLRVALTQEPQSLDPAQMASLEERLLLQALYRGLVAGDPVEGKPQPALAARWERSPDGLVYTFYLKPASFFSGRPIGPEDVKYSLTRLVDPAVGSPWAFLLRNVAGVTAFARGQAPEVEGIRVVGPAAVEITLVQPQADFLASLACPAAAIVDRFQVEAAGARFGRPGGWTDSSAVAGGSGPFSLVEWVRGHFLTLESNRAGDGASGGPRRVEVRFLESEEAFLAFVAGEVELALGLDGDGLRESGADLQLAACRRLFPLAGTVALAWPGGVAGAGAAAAALDRQALVRLLDGLGQAWDDGRAAWAGPDGQAMKEPVELSYPAKGLALYLPPPATQSLAQGAAAQLSRALGVKFKARPTAAPNPAGPALVARLAPYQGADWRPALPEAGPTDGDRGAGEGQVPLIPLLRPTLAALVEERVQGFTLSPFGDLDWAALRLDITN